MPRDAAGLQEPPASYLDYKFEKAVYDYARVHEVMFGASPDHFSFDGNKIVLDELRYAVDDLLADLAAAWDALIGEVLDNAKIPPGKIVQRLSDLQSAEQRAWSVIDRAWTACFSDINDGRNFKQHEGFWPPAFGIGQGGGAFGMDLILTGIGTEAPGLYLMRATRYGISILAFLDDSLMLGHNLTKHSFGCPKCYGDERIDELANW